MEGAALLETGTVLWAERGHRARELAARYPFAAEWLRLYAALVDVQEPAFHAAQAERPAPATLARYVARQVVPRVIEVTAAHGPARLAQAMKECSSEDLEGVVACWLEGEEQRDVERYLARASAGPVLEALREGSGTASRGERSLGHDERRGGHCPRCGGLPQLSFFSASGDDLVTAPRRLACSRCGEAWIFPRLTCAGCGETSTGRLVIYGEHERFPHVRVDGCESCDRYLLTVDLRKDPSAVPVVDELAAVPLDLYAQEHGLTKITANVMGL